MPRNRQQVRDAAQEGLDRLLARTDASPELALGDAYLGRRVADVLTHLHGWHLLFLDWVEAIRAGQTAAFPAEGYSWQDLESLNESLHERFKGLDYAAARKAFVASHADAVAALDTLDDDLLTSNDSIEWLGNEALGDVAHECLGGHYDWAQGVLDAAGAPSA